MFIFGLRVEHPQEPVKDGETIGVNELLVIGRQWSSDLCLNSRSVDRRFRVQHHVRLPPDSERIWRY
jgi:hypothetical protein